MDFLKQKLIDFFYYFIDSSIGVIFQDHWGKIAIILVIFGFFRSLSPNKSDPTMTRKKYKKCKPHRNLTVTKLRQ
jgi:hypothetical protein